MTDLAGTRGAEGPAGAHEPAGVTGAPQGRGAGARTAVPPGERRAEAGDGRIRAVDGLRAVAVGGVMAFHFGAGLRGGFLGVDLFFVISGYVITRLLLIERRRTGRVALATFWFRRARRLLPAVLLVLVAVQAWSRLGLPPELRTTTNAQTVAAVTYASNWYAIVAHVGYWGGVVDATPLTHLWSLAVEEQFYLVWPPLLVALSAAGMSRRWPALVAGSGAAASYLLGAALFRTGGPDRAYLGTDARSGALLLGVLCALILTRSSPGTGGRWDRVPGPRTARWARAVMPAAAGALAVLWTRADIHAPWLYGGGLLLAGVCAAAVIVHIVAIPDSATARLLASAPVVAVGRLSYALYLWHWPVHVYASRRWEELGRPTLIALETAATFAVAALSFVLVERPARRIAGVRRLAPPLVACACCLTASALWLQPAPPVEQRSDVVVHGPPR